MTDRAVDFSQVSSFYFLSIREKLDNMKNIKLINKILFTKIFIIIYCQKLFLNIFTKNFFLIYNYFITSIFT